MVLYAKVKNVVCVVFDTDNCDVNAEAPTQMVVSCRSGWSGDVKVKSCICGFVYMTEMVVSCVLAMT